jgi:hypothetical protein
LSTLSAGLLAGVSVLAALPAAGASGHRINESKYGFSLVLPAGWNQVSLTGSDLGSIIGSGKSYANLKSVLTSEATSAASKGLKFFAVSPQGDGSFVPNINVGIFKGSGSLSSLNAQVKATWTQAGAKHLSTKVVHLSFGSAVQGTYELVSATSPSSTPPVWETQVYSPHKGQVFITTFSASTKPAVQLTAAVVMSNWRFTK